VTEHFSTSRSTVVLTGGQAVAIASAFATGVVVARLLQPVGYGAFAVALSVLAWVEPLVSGGLTLALAQAVSTDSRKLPEAVRWVKRVFLPYAVAVWAAYSAASSLMASALGEARLTALLLVAGLELPSIALFAASRELLMGIGAPGRQAAAISTYAVFRGSFIVALAAATRSPAGALGGNAVAALASAVVAVALLRASTRDSSRNASARVPGPGARLRGAVGADHPPLPAFSGVSFTTSVLRSGAPTLLMVLLTQLALTMDLWTVKRVVADPQAVGWYAAGRVFAFLPYMLATGLALALFPAVCGEFARGERSRALSLTREAVRVLIVCLTPLCAVVVPTASRLARLLFSDQFAGAALSMRVLIIGLACFSVAGTLQAVLVADRRSLFNSGFAGALSVMALMLCSGLVPRYGLRGAAWATTLTGAGGASFLVIYVGRRLGTVVPLATVARVIVASTPLYVLARVWEADGIWLIGQYIGLTGLYALLLVALGEITRGDLDLARTVAADLLTVVRGGRRTLSG
jgi:O-antigen/teichoic acid export membrane protein